jgi:RimJ/RimL family protein N-acetyltransferase
LRGELVELRPIRETDWDALFAVASDPLIWEQHPAHDRWQEPVFREFFRGAIESGGGFVAVDRATGEIIGSTRYHDYKPDEREVEIGWTFLARKYWGGEFNGDMKRIMLAHAFRFVDSVVFTIGRHNVRSRRAVEKIGAVLEKDFVKPDGSEHVLYRLTRTAFPARALATPKLEAPEPKAQGPTPKA